MRTRRGESSESFWPSIVMRKWLNIKPKVHDFSEDEVETESEDDDGKVARAKWIFDTEQGEIATSTHTLGKETKSNSSRLRRSKSETLRVQYINKMNIRVMIGSWNVAGRTPSEDTAIDEWICAGEEPADMFILGFQEVVPLNAGNVLGAEDNRPIPKWEAIIRRTLNNSAEPKTIFKSYSAPPSPIAEILTSDDLADKKDHHINDIKDVSNLKHDTTTSTENENKKYITSRLDWPEFSLDMQPRASKSGTKLRRTFSSTPRIEIDWLRDSQHFLSDDSPLTVGMKREYRSSGNLGMLWPEQEEVSEILSSINSVSDKSSDDDDSSLENGNNKSEEESNRQPAKCRPRYVRIVSKQMVGIYISIWVSRRLRRHINNLTVSPVGVGLMGYMGNKGSVSVSMSLFQTRFCFVCSHLSSGHKEGDQQKRNSDVDDILRRTRFASALAAEKPLTIPSHDRIFWFGDLNYRLDMPDDEIRELISKKSWDLLINCDQLTMELRSGRIFDGWKEGLIEFPPTYKYEFKSSRYVGENGREGEKKRSPAWCDRILWLGKGITQLFYRRSELDLSDHRPVSSVFQVEVEVFDERKLQRILNFTNAGFSSDEFAPA